MKRAVIPGCSLVGALYGWTRMHEVGHWAGLGVLLLLALILMIFLAFAVVFGFPYFTAGLIPREWRANYRGWAAKSHWYRKATPRGRQRSSHIPAWLDRLVLFIDGYQCAHCGSSDDLNVDHLIPWRLGGLTALFNLVTLCGPCNRIKGAYFVRRNGSVCYPHQNPRQIPVAAEILASERYHRLSPLRWVKAAYCLGWI